MRYYTGVGSRKTPGAIFDLMVEIGRNLAIDGYVLRSGGASGADTAFEQGCDLHEGMKEIYLPWKGFSGIQGGRGIFFLNDLPFQYQAESYASQIHPAWDILKRGARALHTRNIYQVLGEALDKPSDFLICYAQPTNTGVKGGTNTAVKVALQYNIPVFNLWDDKIVERFENYVQKRR